VVVQRLKAGVKEASDSELYSTSCASSTH